MTNYLKKSSQEIRCKGLSVNDFRLVKPVMRVFVSCSAVEICRQEYADENTFAVVGAALRGNWEMPLVPSNPKGSCAMHVVELSSTPKDEETWTIIV